VNYSFAEVTEDQIRSMAREVAKARPKAITTYCTNLKAAHLAKELEYELRIPLYDSVSTVVWKSLKMAGVDTRRIQGWGSLFAEEF
jgi:maleate isomerase